MTGQEYFESLLPKEQDMMDELIGLELAVLAEAGLLAAGNYIKEKMK